MPWTNFGEMSVKDLGAIYDYLKTLPPVKNEVVKKTKEIVQRPYATKLKKQIHI